MPRHDQPRIRLGQVLITDALEFQAIFATGEEDNVGAAD